MKSSTPFFSVIVSLYNKEKYIKRAINSILSQSFQNFEIIIINDESTDKSLSIVKKIKNKKIKIIDVKHCGASQVRNIGIKQAKGIYITFLDADDEYQKDFLQIIYDLYNKYNNIQLLATSFKTIYSNGIVTQTEYKTEQYDCLVEDYISSMAQNTGFYIHISSVAIHKDLIKKLGGFHYSKKNTKTNVMGEDFDLWLRVSEIHKTLAYSNKLGSIYHRDTENNITNGNVKGDIDYIFCEKTLKRLIEKENNKIRQNLIKKLLYKFYGTIIIQLLIRNKFIKAKNIINKIPKNAQYTKFIKMFNMYKNIYSMNKKIKRK